MALLNVDEAARYLGVSPEEIEKLAHDGQIESYRIGGVYLRFKRDSLVAFRSRLSPQQLPAREDPDKKASFFERIQDFWYFNNLYIISLSIIAALVVMIFK